MTPATAPHGFWPSRLDADAVAGATGRIVGLTLDGDDVYWVESRPPENGRCALVRWRAGEVADVVPRELNVRNRVHEYGGGAFAVGQNTLVFTHDADRRLYCLEPTGRGSPRPLTPPGPWRYADIELDPRRGRVLCVVERPREGREPENLIAAVPLAGGEPEPVVSGADFYAFPRLSPGGDRMAFMCWNHPRMPWDGSEICVATLDAVGRPGAPTRVAGGPEESVFQPAWSPEGKLCFVSDRSGWWNLYRADAAGPTALCPAEAEFGTPQWVFGLSTYAFAGEHEIACTFLRNGTWHLGVLRDDRLTELELGLTEMGYVRAGPGRIVLVGGSPARPLAIHTVDPRTGASTVIHQPGSCPLPAAYVAQPEPVRFPSEGGAVAHGLFYPPCNPEYRGPDGERPPLIVTGHGGPTAAASSALNPTIQFWTSRGFAVLDVNYRGSTGYGRAFRQSLAGRWGVADVDDCVAGALHLAAQGRIDGRRMAIRGGSAGGFTALCALVFRDVFRAGASYYGVSDLELLAADTHKFESRYLESLVGPYPERRDLYQARSPINFADRLQRPVIFFQGTDDRVVPPSQARRMVERLRGRGVAVEYVEFPGEQHGFRSARNISQALRAELAFYQRVLC